MITGFAAMTAPVGLTQEATYAGEFERPYGMGYGQETRPFSAGTRDRNGNRVIVDGRIIYGNDLSTLSNGLSTGWGDTTGSGMLGHGAAIGNQLNVITQGNYNTVIIDSTQINEGNQTVILNGELELHD